MAMDLNRPKFVVLFLRFSLGTAFLSAVADRFGMWGPPGASNAAWGDFANFTAYTGVINPFVPKSLIPALAWLATILEAVLGLFLLAGFKPRETGFASGLLLLLFALAMCVSVGIKQPLNYSVFSASAAAFALSLLAKPDMPKGERNAQEKK
jgi:uncharacterized membrane protein YphA (DoxX/SURF4 family)